MEWDKVKGFFRRSTQLINQNYRHTCEPTVDTEYENLATIVDGLQQLAKRTSERVKRLASYVDGSIAIVHEASIDPPQQQFIWDEMASLNKKLAHAAQALSPHSGYAKKVLIDHAVQLDRFVADVGALTNLKEERKQCVLEYDFFKNKTAQLRASPPSDPQRIPRNEGRVMEFQTKYEALNTRLKQALTGLMSTGERLCAQSHQMMATELNRFAEESVRAWKAANIIASKPGVVGSIAAAVSSTVQSLATPSVNTQHQASVNNNAAAFSNNQQQQPSLPTASPILPQQQQPQPQPYQDNKTWNQSQSTFNFNRAAAYEQQQNDSLNNTQTLGGTVSQTNFNATINNNNSNNLAAAPARPPPVLTPKEKGARTVGGSDDPFRI